MKQTTLPKTSFFSLLLGKHFAGFFQAQFWGALNDNLAKNTLVALLTFQAAQFATLNASTVSNLATGLFILPFFILSAFCGAIADRYQKRSIALWVKGLEFFIQCGILLGFYLTNVWILLVCIFLLGVHSTLFGPIKHSLIPQITKPHEIIAANGLVSGGTFVAILLGTILGGVLGSLGIAGGIYAGVLGIVLALLGFIGAYFIPQTPLNTPQEPLSFSLRKQTKDALHCAKEPVSVWRSIFGISWFWFLGATLLSQFPVYAKDILGTDPTGLTVLLALFSVGVALGSLACNRLSNGQVEIGLVPLGSIGLTIGIAALYFLTPQVPYGTQMNAWQFLMHADAWPLLITLFLVGFFGGIYIVPLYALIQTRSSKGTTARVVGANNILNSGFMVASAILSILALQAGSSIAQLFLACALMNLVVAFWIYKTVPEFLLRFVAWTLTHLMYRMNVQGLEKLPFNQRALIVCNHVSFVDALILMGVLPRPTRFVMDSKIYQTPILHWLFKDAKAIPIASQKDNPQMMQKAFEEVQQALEDDQWVLIFPEGKITHDGAMNPWRKGMSQILQTTPAPVYVLALGGLWGSFFSRKHGGKAFQKPFARGFFNSVDLRAQGPFASSISPQEAQQICEQLRTRP